MLHRKVGAVNLQSTIGNLQLVDEHLNQVAILQAQLEGSIDIKTPFGEVKPKITTPVKAKSISRRSAA